MIVQSLWDEVRKLNSFFIHFVQGNRYLVSQPGVHHVLSNDRVRVSSMGNSFAIVFQTPG